jgi:hypothetical protein
VDLVQADQTELLEAAARHPRALPEAPSGGGHLPHEVRLAPALGLELADVIFEDRIELPALLHELPPGAS